MNRPKFVTSEDIARWSEIMDNDTVVPKELLKTAVPKELLKLAIIREVCYAGIWLSEKLSELSCPDVLITRIQWTAGKLAYGRDIWKVHQDILEDYKQNKLIFEDDEPSELN